MQHRPPFNLGEFRVDPEARIVSTASGEAHLEPKVMAVLVMLAEHANEVVAREEFIAAVWPREFSGDEGLTRAISQLRKVFGSDTGGQVVIETIPRTGYRLQLRDEPGRREAEAGPAWGRWLAVAAMLLALGAVIVQQGMQEVTPPEPGLARGAPADLVTGTPPEGASEADGKVTGDEGKGVTGDAAKAAVLAVLPFDSPGGTAEDAALALGLSDEILRKLSGSTSLSVLAGSSASRIASGDLETLAREFDVSHVIDGSVQHTEAGLLVIARLREAASGREIWTEELSRPKADTWTIAGFLASTIHATLGASPLDAFSSSLPPDPSAYETYLQARALMRSASGENLAEAMRLLQKAVHEDPQLAPAWAGLAWARLDRANVETSTEIGAQDTLDNWRAARRDANMALALDAASIDALLVLIVIDLMEREDTLVETESRIRSLLERAPNHANVNHRLGVQLMSVGRWEESLRFEGRALQLDPLSGLVGFYYATALLGSERYQEFLALLRRAGTEDSWRRSWPWLVFQLQAENYAEARSFFSILEQNPVFYLRGLGLAETVDPDTPQGAKLLELVDRLVRAAELGKASTDAALGDELLSAAETDLIPDHWAAQLLGVAGLDETAFELARKRIDRGDIWYRELLMMPAFKSLRSDPGVMELFAASGQLDYWLQTGHWPDYCTDPELPYDCEIAGRAYREASISAGLAGDD